MRTLLPAILLQLGTILATSPCYGNNKIQEKADQERLQVFDEIWQACAIKHNKLSHYSSPQVLKVTKQLRHGQPDGTEIVRVQVTAKINDKVRPEKFEVMMKSDFSAYKEVMYAPNFDIWVGHMCGQSAGRCGMYTGCMEGYGGEWRPR